MHGQALEQQQAAEEEELRRGREALNQTLATSHNRGASIIAAAEAIAAEAAGTAQVLPTASLRACVSCVLE